MTVFGSVYITLLSLFLQQVRVVHSNQNPIDFNVSNTTFSHTYEKGHGPQVGLTHGPPSPEPISYHWLARFHLNGKPEGIPVYFTGTNFTAYTIYPNYPRLRGFLITDSQNATVLTADDTKKAKCCHAHTFEASPNVNYTIAPRGRKTDRWYMSVLGDDGNMIDFIYYRAQSTNNGDITFVTNDTLAASLQFGHGKLGNATDTSFVIELTVQPTTQVDASYFIGLWNLVNKEMWRCGA